MLPLVFKTSNAVGNTDYDDGLFPDLILNEDYTNLGTLGNINEPLLAAAINDLFSFTQPHKGIILNLRNYQTVKSYLLSIKK